MAGIYLSVNNDSDGFRLPVNPEVVNVSREGSGEQYKIARLGSINIPKDVELDQFSLESFFPSQAYEFMETAFRNPGYYIDKLNKWQKQKTIVRYVYVNGAFTINELVTIESFEYTETYGTSDINFTLSLLKYVEHGPRKMKVAIPKAPPSPVPKPAPKPKVTKKKTPPRQNKKPKQRTYVMVRGDSLWKIARDFTKNGARYPEIQKLNNIKNSQLRRLPIGLKLKVPANW